MARFLAALLLASSLLVVARLSHAAAPSIAEEFWHTVLPGYELSDAILWHLQPDTSSESTAEGTGEGDDTSNAADDSEQRLSRQWPYYYWKDSALRRSSGHSHTPAEPAADDNAERLSQQWPYYYWKDSALLHKSSGHSHMPAAGDNRAKMNRSAVFFHEAAVQVGRSLPFLFPPARRPALGMLQRDVADSIPFSTSALPGLLALLGVAKGSAQAADMEETVSMCEAPPLAGEPKFCATSLEALLEGAMAALGSHDIRPVTSKLPRSGAPWQPYTIRAVRPVVMGVGSRFVGCHQVVYPYTVYRCHDTGLARLYMVEMEGTRGSVVAVAAICHIDTSQWDPDHPSFKLLGTKPGGPPVCHTLPYGHIIWAKDDGDRSSA